MIFILSNDTLYIFIWYVYIYIYNIYIYIYIIWCRWSSSSELSRTLTADRLFSCELRVHLHRVVSRFPRPETPSFVEVSVLAMKTILAILATSGLAITTHRVDTMATGNPIRKAWCWGGKGEKPEIAEICKQEVVLFQITVLVFFQNYNDLSSIMSKLSKSPPAYEFDKQTLTNKNEWRATGPNLQSHCLLHAPVWQPRSLSPFLLKPNFARQATVGIKTRRISRFGDDDTVRSGSTSCFRQYTQPLQVKWVHTFKTQGSKM